jgi:predicted dehydrogenase/NADPH:quinone reductase-like Zn-dependent oxidoreductase
MLLEFGRAGWIGKARQQSDKVSMVLDKVKSDGLVTTFQAVRNKLDEALPLGYCNVGVAIDVGRDVSGVSVGDRVASNGKHAEIVSVPVNLCAKVPVNVSDDAAAFTVLGAIALEGIRLVQPTLGEAVVVTGLGIIGLITVQLLRANGCRVLGLDFDRDKLTLARGFGAEVVNLAAGEDPVAAANVFARSRGVDAVLITASTDSNEPVHQAAMMCRKRGRIVLVGVTGLQLSRQDFYQKELSFQVSCSYGPGRYDVDYEEGGHDYPVGFVRWTARRNFEAMLDMMADDRVDMKSLISHRFAIEDAEKAYELIGGAAPSLGILLEYASAEELPEHVVRQATVRLPSHAVAPSRDESAAGEVVVAFLGAGKYAASVLIPAFQAAGARCKIVASSGGVSGVHVARKYGFAETTTDAQAALTQPEVNVVVIATRHDSHARYVIDAISAGKHVFVEKPLCLTLEELRGIEAVLLAPPLGGPSRQSDGPVVAGHDVLQGISGPVGVPTILMVGFNRRFAPHVVKIKQLLSKVSGPKSFIMTVNAGVIPTDHWTQDAAVGGGRIVGEGCHFIDLLRHLAESPIVGFEVAAVTEENGPARSDNATIILKFQDGSVGTIHYLSNGNRGFPKERLDVLCAGRVLQLDNFRKLSGWGWPGFRGMTLWRQDKGNRACAAAFVESVEKRRSSPIPYAELLEVSRITVEIGDRLK